MWCASPISDFIAAELRHMHRPEIADLALVANFAIRDRALLIHPAPQVRAEIRSQSNRVFFETWICLAAMRAGLPIDTALIIPGEDRHPWQVNYLGDHKPAGRDLPLPPQP